MLFPTLDFGLFFLVVFTVGWTLHGSADGRKFFLLACSYFFYGYWDWRFVFLLGGSTGLSYAGALLIERTDDPRRRRHILAASVAIHVAVLGAFKYLDFFVGSLNDLLEATGLERDLPVLKVVLPVGISFFTFQGISYLVDVYRRVMPASRAPIDFFLYMSFFPHLVAGPIVRAADFLPQLKRAAEPGNIRLGMGFLLILVGLFKKSVVANYLSVELVDPVFAEPGTFAAADVWLAAYAYAIQIYCDFSAYTDMAIGLAALLGFQFPRNFNQPYRADSLQDFWRRWHMTLSAWLRDYLYIPLGGSRGGFWRTNRNLLLTMVLGGIWHGANWTFVVWGTLHGAGLVAERLWRRGHPARPQGWLGRALSVAWVFHFVCLAWIFFRADSFATAFTFLAAFGHWGQPAQFLSPFLVTLVGLGFAAQFLPAHWLERVERHFLELSPVEKGLCVGMVIVMINAMAMEGVAPFIYFQF
ncbi:MAG TPA: MBOAT family protein [Azospirillaceae bacterium]|nr:MBOAT family protein [Azospirillaceae bacterium]